MQLTEITNSDPRALKRYEGIEVSRRSHLLFISTLDEYGRSALGTSWLGCNVGPTFLYRKKDRQSTDSAILADQSQIDVWSVSINRYEQRNTLDFNFNAEYEFNSCVQLTSP